MNSCNILARRHCGPTVPNTQSDLSALPPNMVCNASRTGFNAYKARYLKSPKSVHRLFRAWFYIRSCIRSHLGRVLYISKLSYRRSFGPMCCCSNSGDNDERFTPVAAPSRKKRRIMKMADNENENKQPRTEVSSVSPPPVLEVFTAVVVDGDHNNNNNGDDYDDEAEEYFVAPAQSLYLFKTFSLLLGLLIGAFIQFSSLGANYLVEQVGCWKPQQQQEQEQQDALLSSPCSNNVWWGCWAFVWSMGTSTVGVLVLLTLRSLLLEISNTPPTASRRSRKHPHNALLLLIMECYFAVGALVGVCLAWMGTDVVLQAPRHLIHTTVTLILTLAWCKLLTMWFFPVLSTSSSFVLSLLTNHYEDNSRDAEEEVECHWEALEDIEMGDTMSDTPSTTTKQQQQQRPNRFWVQCTSLFLGSLIGIFIQYSSLGANFLLQYYDSDSDSEALLESQMKFSLAWSVFTSGMGIAVLFLVRGLVVLFSGHDDDDDDSHKPRAHNNNTLITVECFFAIGAVLGLNVAWTTTDVLLDLGSHVTSSVLTLVGTLLWCKLVLYCCGYGRSKNLPQPEHVDDDEPGNNGWSS